MVNQEILCQNPFFDALFCEDESLDELLGGGFGFGEEKKDIYDETHEQKHSSLLETDVFWDDDELDTLLSKEKESRWGSHPNLDFWGLMMQFRKDAAQWMLRVTAHYGFKPETAVLGVCCYDRFMSTLYLQKDKPWMSQLAAVACLSIAAKVEEIQVPFLLDLQVGDAKFLFEAKTVQRMELLVLSTLGWKMKLVTPLSFFDYIVRRYNLCSNLSWEFLRSFKNVIMSIITDSMFLDYLPSVITAAALMFVSKDFKPCEWMHYQNQLMDALRTSNDKVNECHKLILKLMEGKNKMQGNILKRKYQSVPDSPIGVVDVYFSCESSNDSWDVSLSSVSTSSMSLLKRSRVQDMASDAVA